MKVPAAAPFPERSEAALSPLSAAAKETMQGHWSGAPLFLGDWTGATFLHYEVDPGKLQQGVPFPLDLHHGRAHVSLVAFTMHRFRIAACRGRLSALTTPLATQRFLNLRTYVRGRHGPGIFFMREWLDHPLAALLVRATFGLPSLDAEIDYETNGPRRAGSIRAAAGGGAFSGRSCGPTRTAEPGGRDAFLVERYLAYTAAGFRPLAFRVWHEPWPIRDFEVENQDLARFFGDHDPPWAATARFAGAVSSEGVTDVWMGRPRVA